MGYQVIDTDEISHHILEDQGVINELTDIFGNEILEQGKVNRKALGNIIFRNKDKQLLLNKIIHPRVIDVVKKELHEVINDIVFVDVPLLYESGMESMMDKVIVISASLDTQILRLVNRDNIERDYAIDKINMQMPLQEKSKLADFIIDNNGIILYANNAFRKLASITNETILPSTAIKDLFSSESPYSISEVLKGKAEVPQKIAAKLVTGSKQLSVTVEITRHGTNLFLCTIHNRHFIIFPFSQFYPHFSPVSFFI